jgi:hypothetical protein
MDALPNRLELVVPDVTHQAQFLSAAALPLADDTLALGKVVAVYQMMLRVPLPVRHRADRQHVWRSGV